MSKRVAIVQSSYIPWKGYFDLINSVDEFVLYDDRQYTRRDWRNRNRIKTAHGVQWLTVPVKVKGKYHQRIDETLIDDPQWHHRHWRTLAGAYGAARHFTDRAPVFERIYSELDERRLSYVNRILIEAICQVLGVRTRLTWSTDYDVEGARTERLVNLCRAAGATTYLTGPTAASYLDESMFDAQGISVEWMSYEGYPEYEQLHPPFDHHVSILDVLFNVGDDAPRYLKSFTAVGAPNDE